MNYQQGLFDLEALVNSQRQTVPLSNFPSTSRPLQYSSNLAKDPQTFQTQMSYYQGQPLRVNGRDDQEFMVYDSPHLNRAEENLRYSYPNNNNLLDYMQQRKPPNNAQYMSASPQLSSFRQEHAQIEDNHQKRNVRPPSLNVPSKSLASNLDLINLESDESLAQMYHSRANKEFMLGQNASRPLPYNTSNEEAINQALLLNSLNYGKQNQDYLMSQLNLENLYGINELDVLGSLNPLILNAMYANSSIENLYKQMQREYLNQDQQLLLQLGQNLPQMQPQMQGQHQPQPQLQQEVPMKQKKMVPIRNTEPILIDDSPESDAFAPFTNTNFERDRRGVKEEFMGKPPKSYYQGFEQVDDRRANEITVPPQYLEDLRNRQGLNNGSKRFMNERDQFAGFPPEKKLETSNGKGVRTTGISQQPEKKYDIKSLKKDTKKPPPKIEKAPLPMINKSYNEREDIPIRQMPLGVLPQQVKKPENGIQEFKMNDKQQVDPSSSLRSVKEPVPLNKKTPKIMIEKISLPESATLQPESFENNATAKHSPTMLYLHKKHGQVQINPSNVEEISKQAPLQSKVVYPPTASFDKKIEFQAPFLSVPSQGLQTMSTPLSLNQSPDKLTIDTNESLQQWTMIEPIEEPKIESALIQNKDKLLNRKKRPESVAEAANLEPLKKERKMNKLQLLRFSYQTYLEELRKPYKISIHIDPTNPDEKIVPCKVGDAYQVDMVAALNNLNNQHIMRPKTQLRPVWTPENITIRMLEEYYTRFGQIIGQRVTNEEAALKNLVKFDMDVEKALDNVKKNQLYFQNSFRLDQRVLRNRTSHVS